MTIIRSTEGIGLLTKEIRTRKDLTFFEKILICELDSLTNNVEGTTDITTKELTKMYGVSVATVNRSLKKLENLGFITREVKMKTLLTKEK
ncbi:winged helix-turn-helix transcriptional regulator [Staphylococcus pettenkoferi]|uniref:winged helix-turn-helix transcriptional regulator n=1 Tax=Staphylococcus pettenkoferi TaxID=170573 RepID=UPI0011A019F2|nr:winged helix-turn-helix transcriptional regulator [Staphylococcus pettenkoferi]